MYDSHMHRTTIFLPEDVEHRLDEIARHTKRPRAEVVREAIVLYLEDRPRPLPRSFGSGTSPDDRVTSRNVKGVFRSLRRIASRNIGDHSIHNCCL
jgi:hypothetical protein